MDLNFSPGLSENAGQGVKKQVETRRQPTEIQEGGKCHEQDARIVRATLTEAPSVHRREKENSNFLELQK